MAKSYVHIDEGAQVDPFWQTTVPPQSRQLTLNERLDVLKKSFHLNAIKIDSKAIDKSEIILGKIGTDESNTEFRVWKSTEVIINDNVENDVEFLFQGNNEIEAIGKFAEITGGTFDFQYNPNRVDSQNFSIDQPLINQSEMEQYAASADPIQDLLDQKAAINFAQNAEKIDFVLGMIGKSQIDKNSKFRIWKTQNHWKNDRVEYLTDSMDYRSAVLKFNDLTKNR